MLLESNNEALGHGMLHHSDKNHAGVYTTPSIKTAMGYAVPQIVFGDFIWHKVVIEVLVNNGFDKRITQKNTSEKKQWCHHAEDTYITRIHFALSSPPGQGQPRYHLWKPELECRLPRELPFNQIVLLAGGMYGPKPSGVLPPWTPPGRTVAVLPLVPPQSKAAGPSKAASTCTAIVPAEAPWRAKMKTIGRDKNHPHIPPLCFKAG